MTANLFELKEGGTEVCRARDNFAREMRRVHHKSACLILLPAELGQARLQWYSRREADAGRGAQRRTPSSAAASASARAFNRLLLSFVPQLTRARQGRIFVEEPSCLYLAP